MRGLEASCTGFLQTDECIGYDEVVFFFSSRRRHTRYWRDWSSDVCSSDLVLMVVVPMLWVLGAPVTLALRALAARTDGSFGARETLLQLVHSRPLRLLGHPIIAGVLFAASLVVFYYSRIFDLALSTHTGHVLMVLHF